MRYGYWKNMEQGVRVCTNCGSIVPVENAVEAIPLEENRFCYYCGARMVRQQVCEQSGNPEYLLRLLNDPDSEYTL